MESTAFIALLIAFTIASGVFSGTETALFSLPSTRVRTYRKSKNKKLNLIADLLRRPQDLLVTLLMLNITVNIIIQNLSSHLFGNASSWFLKVGVPLGITLVFGDIIPKSLAIQNNAFISRHMAPVVDAIKRGLGPFRQLVTQVTAVVSQAMFFFLRKDQEISQKELLHVLSTSQDRGLLHKDEGELVRGYLTLQNAQVKELMRPRDEIIYYNIEEPIQTLTHRFVDQRCSRMPVCRGSLDDILGVITAKQFFLHRHEIASTNDIVPYLNRPFFVPETTPGRKLLRQFTASSSIFAIVVNEYGSCAGLITREDLIETVVGEISDQRDLEKHYTRSGKHVVIASGKMELGEFRDIFHLDLSSENNMVTVGGWLTERLGDIPKSGTNYVTKDFLFHILSADEKRIKRVYIRRLKPATEEGL